MVKLNETLICGRTKMSSVEHVRRLNCWGCDLDDISIIEEMPNIEVLSLSVNSIATLKHFKGCRHLRELYMRGNRIGDLREVEHLRHLTDLRVLWLDENPCAQLGGYRSFVLKTLPFLTNLDNRPVSQSENCEFSFQRTSSPLPRSQSRCFDDIQRTNSRVSLASVHNGCQPDEVTLRQQPQQQHNRSTNTSSFDHGYESSHSDHSNKSFRGQDLCYEENVCCDYRPTASNANGNASPGAISRYSTSSTVVSKRQTSGNVLRAILTLLDDLDEQNLKIVSREVAQRLQNYT